MYYHFHRSALALLACCLVTLLAACSWQPFDTTTGQPSNTGTPVSMPQSALTPSVTLPQTQIGCPTAGTSRAAIMAPIGAGADPSIVYIFNQGLNPPVAGILRRYDIVTGAKTDIVNIPQGVFGAAQLSTDGQWIIFVSQVAGHAAIQMVRVDGQSLQTLYCDDQSSILQLQMSPDQQTIVFAKSGAAAGVYMFHLAFDDKATKIAGGNFSLVTWLDNTHLYALSTAFQTTAPPKLALLDINKPGQTANALPQIFAPASACASFDSSVDATRLYYSQCQGIAATGVGPSSIAELPAAGGKPNTIYNSATQAVTTLRVASTTVLLFLVKNPPPAKPVPNAPPTNGLWRINVDGTGLTHLVNIGAGQDAVLNEYSQYTWSNVSRDGKMFAIKTIDQNGGQALSFEAIAGGNATTFVQFAGVGNVHIVGWTSM
ncbi:MAG TPA: hypothetical protein VFU49_21720 [Ktedonobacteraceae bacterium]|nr:hypothetical protein [Ktedonobacteraceae bacterium]